MVELVGEFDPGQSDGVAKLQILVDDPMIASLSPDELLPRLRLLGQHGVWCKHWNDEQLDDVGLLEARRQAMNNLDGQLPDDVDVTGMTNIQRHETYLHLLTKEIILREKRIKVPPLCVTQTRQISSGRTLERTTARHGATLQLSDVFLEKSVGPIKPDIVAVHDAIGKWAAGKLHIEVTVTHGIDAAKAARICNLGVPTLEINLSKMGGKLTRTEFFQLVVDDVVGKSWVYHPAQSDIREQLQADLDVEEAALARELTKRANVAPSESDNQLVDSTRDNLYQYKQESRLALSKRTSVEVAKAAEQTDARYGWLTGRALAEWKQKYGRS